MTHTERPTAASNNGHGTLSAQGGRVPLDPDETPVRRVLRLAATVSVLVLAAGIFAYSCSKGETSNGTSDNPVIVVQFPAPGGRALRQTEVGAELVVGYDGRLVVNGVEIPEEQMEGAVDPATLTEAELRQYGVRPTSRNRVVFRPGPGKVIEAFEPGQVTIELRYFKDLRADTTTRTETWTVTVV